MTNILDSANAILLFSMPGAGEWLWLVLIVFIFFGAKKIPELAKGLGRGIREFGEAKAGKDDGAQRAEDPATTHS